MIDIENEIFSLVATELRANVPGIFVTGDEINGTPTVLPCVSFVEVDNYSPKAKIDSSGVEKYSNLAYKATVYSGKTSGHKAECKQIMSIIDSLLFPMNFTRESKTPEIPIDKIYWQSARYRAQTDGTKIYRI